MQDYLATFFTHFGAVRFSRALREAGVPCRLMPVPRRVSSSCGSCVRFSAPSDQGYHSEDIEHLFLAEGDQYRLIYSSL